MQIAQLSVDELTGAIRDEKLSVEQCLEHFRTQTESQNSSINAFNEFDFDEVPMQLTGELPLLGIPVGIKAGICTKQFKTTASSSMLSKYQSVFDATVVQRLKDAGAQIIGKTNMDEFAMGSSTEKSFFGPTANPWNKQCVPGGSSGGSAAAVAAAMVPLTLGSDTGGSIRQPAAFCGITGLKPTYGLVSRLGLIAYASSLDQIGPMGRSVKDVARMLNVIAGHDPHDSTSLNTAPTDYVSGLEKKVTGLRIGICKSQLTSDVDEPIVEAVRQALSVLESLGAKIVDIDLPHEKYSVAAYYIIAACEASSNLSRFDGVRYTSRADSKQLLEMYTQTRSIHFGAEVKRRILLGAFALSSGYYDQYYVKASKVRQLIKQDFEKAFESVDVIAGPTTPTTAFPLDGMRENPVQMYLADVFTVSANLAGIPAASVPCGFSNGLPIGLQLQGPALGEKTVLNVGHQFQQATDWHTRRPTV